MTDLVVSFSGGRTSGFMCKWLIDNTSHFYNLHFIYSNTGQEHEKTLEFVNNCDMHFGLNLVWVEADVKPDKGRGNGTGFTITDFKQASRDGRPFEDVIAKYGIPNPDWKHCNRELKLHPMRAWRKENNLENASFALGIRIDEPTRIKPKRGITYPLVDMCPMTKQDILDWWKTQPFDLEIPEHLGNCVTCWKKSDRKLATIAREEPARFDFFMSMELLYGGVHAENEPKDQDRVFWRKRRTTFDILELANDSSIKDFIDYNHEECAEECGSMFGEEDAV